MAGDAIRHLPRTPPARPRARREPQHDVHALFLVALGVQRLARAPIHRAHLARELTRSEPPRQREPLLLILRRRHPAQEAQLGPADLARAERGIEQGSSPSARSTAARSLSSRPEIPACSTA